MNNHFRQAYSIDENPLPTTCNELKLEVTRIHNSSYSNHLCHLWENAEMEQRTEDISNQIRSLATSKDPGPMQMQAHLLQKGIKKIAPPLTRIFNGLLRSGAFPNSWKESFLIPIPKQGKPQEVTNYWGVCIQSVIPKLFDALLTKKMQSQIESIIP